MQNNQHFEYHRLVYDNNYGLVAVFLDPRKTFAAELTRAQYYEIISELFESFHRISLFFRNNMYNPCEFNAG